MIEPLFDPWNTVTQAIVLLIAVVVVWEKGFKPLSQWMVRWAEKRKTQDKLTVFADHWNNTDEVKADAHRWPTLQQIADQFKPNHGDSLYDIIKALQVGAQQAARERTEIRDDIKEMKNLIEIHIVDRRNGGRRHTDPHETT